MSMEQQLIQHVQQRTYADLPPAVIAAARREVLWTLGTSVAGAAAEGSDRIAAFVRQQGGREESTMIGFGDRLPAALAGLANGSFAKALEYEDKYWMDEGHGYAVGVAVVPAAFAIAEHLGGVDGKTLLTAVALATDIQARLLTGAPRSLTSGWNATYLLSVFGATLAAAKLLKLNAPAPSVSPTHSLPATASPAPRAYWRYACSSASVCATASVPRSWRSRALPARGTF